MNPRIPLRVALGAFTYGVVVALAHAADPQIFDPVPFRLESPLPARPVLSATSDGSLGVRIPLPVGPVRIDYGVPVTRWVDRAYLYRMDAPGPGYRALGSGATRGGEG